MKLIKSYSLFIVCAISTLFSCFFVNSEPSALWSIPNYFLIAGPLFLISLGLLLLSPYPIDRSKINQMILIHLTDKNNKDKIMHGNVATLNRSLGLYQNIGNILIGKCLFMFNGHPNCIVKTLNLFKKYKSENEALVTVKGQDVSFPCYGRLLDNSILIPNQYDGPATWTEPKKLQNGRDNSGTV